MDYFFLNKEVNNGGGCHKDQNSNLIPNLASLKRRTKRVKMASLKNPLDDESLLIENEESESNQVRTKPKGFHTFFK